MKSWTWTNPLERCTGRHTDCSILPQSLAGNAVSLLSNQIFCTCFTFSFPLFFLFFFAFFLLSVCYLHPGGRDVFQIQAYTMVTTSSHKSFLLWVLFQLYICCSYVYVCIYVYAAATHCALSSLIEQLRIRPDWPLVLLSSVKSG